jgi:2'-5' RNA ligase
MRSFIAIEIEPDNAIAEIMREISESGVRVKMVEKENIHLTLKFLGDISEEQVNVIAEGMKDLRTYSSFSIRLRGIGAFPSEHRPRTIWVGLEYPQVMEEIWEKIEYTSEKAGIEREKRGFSPHITIARVKDQRNTGRLKHIIIEHENDDFGERDIAEIKLKKSVLTQSGPIYSDIFSVKLKE